MTPRAQDLQLVVEKTISIMRTTDPKSVQKQTPPDTDTMDREFPQYPPTIEQSVDDRVEWSNDPSMYNGDQGKEGKQTKR